MKKYERLLNSDILPTFQSIQTLIGKKNFGSWDKIKYYLSNTYEIEPEIVFYGKKYGWCYKFKKSSKTLCCLFPENRSFTILFTLSGKDLEKLKPDFLKLNINTQTIVNTAHQYHDGKWLWIRYPTAGNFEDIKKLLSIKRTPKKL